MATQIASLRTTAAAGAEHSWLPATLQALILACLTRLFGRLEQIFQLWQSGQLPLPQPRNPTPIGNASPPSLATPFARAPTAHTRQSRRHGHRPGPSPCADPLAHPSRPAPCATLPCAGTFTRASASSAPVHRPLSAATQFLPSLRTGRIMTILFRYKNNSSNPHGSLPSALLDQPGRDHHGAAEAAKRPFTTR